MKLVCFFVLSLSLQAEAYTVYKYYLVANRQVQQTCIGEDGDIASKINLGVFPSGNVAKVALKAKVCTKSFGYRRVDLEINVPKEVTQARFLSSLEQGSSKTFRKIPSASSGQSSDVTVTRLANRGTLSTFQVSWANGKTAPILIFLETDPAKALAHQRLAGAFPWARIQYKYQHALLPGGLVLEGPLREKTQEI
jgi:hypothetical protein